MTGGDEGLRDGLARALAGVGRQEAAPARVTTAKVASVSGKSAMCVLAGDDKALTRVALAGTSCKVGDSLAAVGQGGRWFAIGVI